MSNKAVIRSYPRAEFGETAKTQLEAAGIWFELRNSNDSDSDVVLPSEAGNIHLVVLENDKKRALYVIGGDWHNDASPNDSPARCPSCSSASYTFGLSFFVLMGLQILVLMAAIIVRILSPSSSSIVFWMVVAFGIFFTIIFKKKYFGVKCKSCGHQGLLKDFRIKLSP